MGSVGANRSTVQFNDMFGGKFNTNNKTLEERYNALFENIINPDRKTDAMYRKNCALCVTAVALQMMGYEVEAMPRDGKQWRGFDSVFHVDYGNKDNYIMYNGSMGGGWSGLPSVRNWDGTIGYYNTMTKQYERVSGFDRMPRGAKAGEKAIVDKVKGWGEGSFGALNVDWKDTSSAHTINIFNHKGNVVLYDGQINKVVASSFDPGSIERYLKRTVSTHTALVRLDNAQIRSDAQDLDKIVRKQRTKNESVSDQLKRYGF